MPGNFVSVIAVYYADEKMLSDEGFDLFLSQYKFRFVNIAIQHDAQRRPSAGANGVVVDDPTQARVRR